MIKAIVFDLDNTLVDFLKFKNACISAAVDAMIAKGLAISKEQAIKVIFDIYRQHGYEYQKIFIPFLQEVSGKIDFKLLATAVSAYRKEKTNHMKTYPNVISTLKELKQKGIKLAILTDAPNFQAYTRLADLDLLYEFDVIVTKDDTLVEKPNPASFQKVLEYLNHKPEDVLMVGDWPDRDIVGAKAVGMKTALAKYGLMPGADSNNVTADYELNDISELLSIV